MYRHVNLISKIKNKLIINTARMTKVFSVFMLVFLMFANPTFATSLDQQIQQTEDLKAQSHTQEKTLAGELSALDSQVSNIQAQINETQVTLNQTDANISETNQQITKAESDIAEQKVFLGEYIKIMYMDGQTSQMELILTSNSFSDFVDQSQYLSTMTQKIQETTGKIEALKTELTGKKKQLEIDKAKIEQLKATQIIQRQNVDNQVAAKNFLIQKTKGDQVTYQKMLNTLYTERAAQFTYGGSNVGGSSGGYPYASTPVYWEYDKNGIIHYGDYNDGYPWHCVADKWNMCARQCTSYAAYMATSNGIISAADIQYWGTTHGYGGEWADSARWSGYTVDKNVQPNTIISWPVGTFTTENYYDAYGHVAYVAGVNGDGTMTIKEFNFLQWDTYDVRYSVPLGNAWIIHPK